MRCFFKYLLRATKVTNVIGLYQLFNFFRKQNQIRKIITAEFQNIRRKTPVYPAGWQRNYYIHIKIELEYLKTIYLVSISFQAAVY